MNTDQVINVPTRDRVLVGVEGLTTYASGSGFAVTGGTGTATNPVR